MAVVNLFGTQVMTGLANTTPALTAEVSQAGGRVRYFTDTVETGATDSINSTYTLARLPASAILLPQSKIHFDDIGGVNSALDVGLFGVDGNITDDDNALLAAVAVATAGSASIVTDIAAFNAKLWSYVAGVTADPFGQLDIKCTVKTAALDAAGTISVELYYTVD